MKRSLVWSSWDGTGMQHAHVTDTTDGVLIDGIVLGIVNGEPFRADYWVLLDRTWRTRRVLVQGADRSLDLSSDGQGRWGREDGTHVAEIAGAVDVDFSVSPMTATIPIRRLALAPGASAETKAVHVTVPGLHVSATKHRFHCLAQDAKGGRFRHENLVTGTSAELAVDADFYVADYPEKFRRIV
jgi:hypothetical protein